MKKNGFKFAIISTCLLLGFICSTHADEKQTPTRHDIRILIDVSGSMKWNDPRNLRIPALQLLANLLPHNTQAGVWTFGRQVNMLVPLGKVDQQWKQQATKAAQEIHSRGLFTNIEETLEKATWDWKKEDKSFERTIILLTDGLVDIDTDPAINHRSRDNILSKIAPQLVNAGATIHTIALSGEADELLLQQLSASSHGWYEKVQDAENLERIFFRMFETTTQPDTLPLVDNQVMVDSNIKEMTMLIFNRGDKSPPLITTPAGAVFGRSSVPASVNWHHETRYDLITINQPAAGSWQIDAEVDPDNRVMVVTDLKMVSTSLPGNLYLDEPQPYFVTLTNEGEVITKPSLLRFVSIALQQTHNDKQMLYKLYDDGNPPDRKASDGTYSTHLSWGFSEGGHELVVQVDGTTFKREKRQRVNVYAAPVITTIKSAMVNGAKIDTLYVIPHADMINPDSISLRATITDNHGKTHQRIVPHNRHNEWKLALSDFPSDRTHSLTIEIEGLRPNGRPVKSQIGPIAFGKAIKQPEIAHPIKAPDAIEEHEEIDAPEEDTVVEAPEVTDEEAPSDDNSKINWIAVIIPSTMFNLLLGCGAYFGYRQWKIQSTTATQKPWEALAHE